MDLKEIMINFLQIVYSSNYSKLYFDIVHK